MGAIVKSAGRCAGIYKECVKTAFAGALAYRFNFILSLLITLSFNILFPLVTILIYNAGASFPGWGFYEVLLIQSVFTLSQGLSRMASGGLLWTTMQHVREGSFEVVLLKPLGPVFYLFVTNFDPEMVGLIIGGGTLFGISLAHTGITSAAAIPGFILLFAAGFAVMTGINIIMAATSFKWVGNSRLPEIFDSVLSFGKYPVTIFPNIIRGFATFIIPVGMVGYYPARSLLGKPDIAALAAVIPCLLFMASGLLLYRYMVRLYEGVGG